LSSFSDGGVGRHGRIPVDHSDGSAVRSGAISAFAPPVFCASIRVRASLTAPGPIRVPPSTFYASTRFLAAWPDIVCFDVAASIRVPAFIRLACLSPR